MTRWFIIIYMVEVFFNSLLGGAFFIFIYMTLWYLVATVTKRSDLADIAWGLGFILLSMLILVSYENASFRPILVSLLVFVWGLRLSMRIFLRNSGKSEDSRYRKWREEWGRWFSLRSYFQIFMLQGFFIVLIALPVIYINTFGGGELGILDIFGVLVWLIGFFFEAVGDWQLSKFLKDPTNKGKIMQAGLWSLTRHPNYFGEVAEWWGIFLIALSVPYGYLTVIGPLTITFLILKVSGIPMLERKYIGNAEFEEYKKNTNAFFPGLRKEI